MARASLGHAVVVDNLTEETHDSPGDVYRLATVLEDIGFFPHVCSKCDLNVRLTTILSDGLIGLIY